MALDKVNKIENESETTEQDITWEKLIFDSEAKVKSCKEKIASLRKSIIFFKKQASIGNEFPRLHKKT